MNIVVTSRSGTPDAALRGKIEAVDQSLRQSFAGLDTDDVVPEIDRSFDQLDVSVSPADVAAYAVAIRDRVDFELVLG